MLAEAGIETALYANEASRLLNEGYATRIAKGRPFVALKLTLTADAMVGYNTSGSEPIVGAEALRFIERERAAADAVLSGAARAEIEDNDLRVHLEGLEGRAGLRVILAGARDLDLRRDLFAAVSGVPRVLGFGFFQGGLRVAMRGLHARDRATGVRAAPL